MLRRIISGISRKWKLAAFGLAAMVCLNLSSSTASAQWGGYAQSYGHGGYNHSGYNYGGYGGHSPSFGPSYGGGHYAPWGGQSYGHGSYAPSHGYGGGYGHGYSHH